MAVSFTPAQYQALLAPLSPHRVASRQAPGGGQRLSYLEAWDVKRFLIRIFGFDGWSSEVLEAEHVFTQETTIGQNKRTGYHVGYKVRLRLTIFNETGPATIFTEAAVGSATLPVLGDAHDMAVKTAESDALKRAATHLGDQFGLSLYNKGQTKALVGLTLVMPGAEGDERNVDVESSSPAPLVLGNDETHVENSGEGVGGDGSPAEEAAGTGVATSSPDTGDVDEQRARIRALKAEMTPAQKTFLQEWMTSEEIVPAAATHAQLDAIEAHCHELLKEAT